MSEEKDEGFDFSRLRDEALSAQSMAEMLRSFHNSSVSSAMLMAANKLDLMAGLLSEANATILALRATRRG